LTRAKYSGSVADGTEKKSLSIEHYLDMIGSGDPRFCILLRVSKSHGQNFMGRSCWTRKIWT